MRVLHVLDHSLPHLSGYSIRSQHILRFQAELGWQPVGLTSPKHGYGGTACERFEGIVYHRSTRTLEDDLPRQPFVGEIQLMRHLQQRIESVAASEQSEIIHAHSPILNGWPALRYCRRSNKPLIYEVRAFWEDAAVDHGTRKQGSLQYNLIRSMETALMQRVDQVVTLSETMRREIIKRGIAGEKVHVVPNAVDTERFQPAAVAKALLQQFKADGRQLFGFIGSFYAYEGLDHLIKSFDKLHREHPNTGLVLVGGGPQFSAMQALAESMEASNAIYFTGKVAPEAVTEYYSLLDVLVYPRKSMRLTELVCPLKPLEAMAMQRVVIGSSVGGIREFVQDGETGFLHAPDDVDALAAVMCKVLENPQMAARIAEQGQAVAKARWSWRANVNRYEDIYGLAISGHSDDAQKLAA